MADVLDISLFGGAHFGILPKRLKASPKSAAPTLFLDGLRST